MKDIAEGRNTGAFRAWPGVAGGAALFRGSGRVRIARKASGADAWRGRSMGTAMRDGDGMERGARYVPRGCACGKWTGGDVRDVLARPVNHQIPADPGNVLRGTFKGADPDTEQHSLLRKSGDGCRERIGAAVDLSRAPGAVMLSYRLLYPFIYLFRIYFCMKEAV